MSETTKPAAAPASAKVAGKDATWWLKEIDKSRQDKHKEYRTRAEKVIKRYRDERDEVERGNKRFNILFSNVETLKPVIFSQDPVPDIRRRFQDADPVGRVAATVLQRTTTYSCQAYDFDAVLERVNMDYLLPGFAVARVQYKPYFKGQGTPQEELIYQEVASEYIPWDRFAMSRSRTYEKVWWGAVGDDLTKDEARVKFGDTVADALAYDRADEDDDKTDKGNAEGKARIWEGWCKRDRQRFFVSEGYDGWVRPPEADPLRLEGFYPWPKPIWSISTNNTLIPVPEYCEYEDQALELDDITERIDVLTSALRRRGVYAQLEKNTLQELVNAADNVFLPVEGWAAMMEKGGLANLIQELPIDGIAKILIQLIEQREQVKQTIYEITGIADIVRGASNPNETLGAQQLKGRWAGLRISSRQKKFACFARDMVRLKAEIIAERFDQQTLSLMSGVKLPTQQEKQAWQQQQQAAQPRPPMPGQPPAPPPQPPDPQMAQYMAQPTWEEVMQVLRSDKLRGFKIDIETDSTVQPDADAEKTARTELLSAIGGFSQQLAPAVQLGLVPQELAKTLIQWALRSFKVGSAVEQELDNMGPPQVPPQIQQMQQELQAKEQELGQREQQVKDQENKAALAGKDTEIQRERLSKAQAIFDLKAQHETELRAQQEHHHQEMHKIIGHAEKAVVDAINPTGAVQ